MLPSILSLTVEDCLVGLNQRGDRVRDKTLEERGLRMKVKGEDVETSVGERVGGRKIILEYFCCVLGTSV